MTLQEREILTVIATGVFLIGTGLYLLIAVDSWMMDGGVKQ